ncbi:hypothetical protein ACFYE8_33260 [Rhizobium leguminosarum]|uniref:hypothetical protein n=1 Tax=Rhizobium leguminosarum TaxID=384 RepID=UPI0036D7CAE2
MSRTVGLSALASTVACVFIGSLCAAQASSLTPQAIKTAPLEVIPASYTPTPKNTDLIVTGSTSKDEQAVDPAAVALPFDTMANGLQTVALSREIPQRCDRRSSQVFVNLPALAGLVGNERNA